MMPRTLLAVLALSVAGLPVAVGQSAPAAPTPGPAVRPAASAPAAVATRPAGQAQARGAGRGTPSRPVMDRVDLDASQITGNRELPRVMYVVPWRQPGAGAVDGRPVNSLLYEQTLPVDREVARRALRYQESRSPGPAVSEK